MEFFMDMFLLAAPRHCVSASNINEYQEYFLGVEADNAYGLQSRHLHLPTVSKSYEAQTPETSGPAE